MTAQSSGGVEGEVWAEGLRPSSVEVQGPSADAARILAALGYPAVEASPLQKPRSSTGVGLMRRWRMLRVGSRTRLKRAERSGPV